MNPNVNATFPGPLGTSYSREHDVILLAGDSHYASVKVQCCAEMLGVSKERFEKWLSVHEK